MSTHSPFIHFREELATEIGISGGKASVLSKLYRMHYNVPEGFIVPYYVFDDNQLPDEVIEQLFDKLTTLMTRYHRKFAVRSSAIAEDSSDASFAGEFETVLNVSTKSELVDAIATVRKSLHAERVKAYSKSKAITADHEISVIIQVMVDADISGVFFTGNPIRGDRSTMIGNYITGLGDALVSGERNAYEFSIDKDHLSYTGDHQFKQYALQLAKIGKELEKEFLLPQDIEFAIANGELFILQSRPITTFSTGNRLNWEINATQKDFFVWTNVPLADLFPYPVEPSTWSVWKIFLNKMVYGNHEPYDLIGGIPYLNLSLVKGMMMKILRDEEKTQNYLELIVNEVPVEIDPVDISYRDIFFKIVPGEMRGEFSKWKLRRNLDSTFKRIRDTCRQNISRIRIATVPELAELIPDIRSVLFDILTLQDYFNERYYMIHNNLRKTLNEEIGEELTQEIIATMVGSSEELESIGPLVGIHRLITGQITEEEYISRYGHRSPYENYLTYPRPYEEADYVKNQIKEYKSLNIDIIATIRQNAERFEKKLTDVLAPVDPKIRDNIHKMVDDLNRLIVKREMTRSEVTRVIAVYRELYLRATALLDYDLDLFYLTIDELRDLLDGNEDTLQYIPLRQENMDRYHNLPILPKWIKGRFDPFHWSKTTSKTVEVYDADGQYQPVEEPIDLIRGSPGSAGIVEGYVRKINTPSEGEQIKPGEILVTTTTNVGWTTIFTRISGVVTDFGATLSHAAIVARELGIPAVVGAGDATSRLETGDFISIDGSKGIVRIIRKRSEE